MLQYTALYHNVLQRAICRYLSSGVLCSTGVVDIAIPVYHFILNIRTHAYPNSSHIL